MTKTIANLQFSRPLDIVGAKEKGAIAKAMTAPSFLEIASQQLRQRGELRDSEGGERSIAKTVAIFNAWTGHKLSEDDGWRFMIALKQAREIQGKFHDDDYIDGAAYFSLLGESLAE